MNYLEFQKQVVDNILDYLPDRYAEAKVSIQQVNKNNGVLLDVLSIILPGENTTPAIYLNDYYRHHQMGREMNDILREIADIRLECQHPGYVDVDKLLDFETIKDTIIFKVIGVHGNKEQLETMPHRIEHDMALVYQILVAKREDGNELLTINNDIQRKLGVSEAELYDFAMENTPRELPYAFRSLDEVMKEIVRKDFISEMLGDTPDSEMREFLEEVFSEQFEAIEEPAIPMYVLSNNHLNNGAAVLFYPEVKEIIAEELQGNYFVLPSSVHETLIVPDNGNMDYEELKDIVNLVNCTEVADEDILTGEVYYFDKGTGILMIAEERDAIISGMNKEPSIMEKLQRKVEQNISGTENRMFGNIEPVL